MLVAFAIIPFGPTIFPHSITQSLDVVALAQQPADPTFADSIRMQIFQIDFGLIFYFGVLTLANYGGTIAGLGELQQVGAARRPAQLVADDVVQVAMGMSLIGAFVIASSLEPGQIVASGATGTFAPDGMMAASNPANWLWLWQPVGLILFVTAAIAETKRAPFDIPEGEPEIIGYFVEYSGIRWGMFFLAEFIEIVFISSVIATIFFGGYQFPFLDPDGFRFGGAMEHIGNANVHLGGWFAPLPHGVVVLLQFVAFGGKVVLLSWFQLLVRWTLPRFRADQLMQLGWKLSLPLALANIMVTALIKLLFM